MAEWWENIGETTRGNIANLGEQFQNFGNQAANWAARTGLGILKGNPLSGPGILGMMPFYTAADDLTGGPARRASANQPQSFAGPDRFVDRRQTDAPVPDAYGFDQFMADLLGITGAGGGGGVNLSGYNTMLEDLASREAGLNTRKGEQEAFLAGLFDAAETRMASDKDALAAAIADALASDQARRETEIGLIRGDEAARLATANAARDALGVAGGEDLSSQVAQNAVAGVGASGSVAERDARILESIERQQLESQIAGLVPMEAMAVSDLGRGYEDRLSALAAERAAIRAQMAQAQASARGASGPSISEVLGAMGAYNEMYGPGEAPSFEGILGSAQDIQGFFGPAAGDVIGIANRLLTGADLSRFDPTSMAGASELLTRLATADPEVQTFLNRNPAAAGAIINYVVNASK